MLGYDRRPDASMNDAAAAALGEAVLRQRFDDLLYVGIGTGIGSAVVSAGIALDSAIGHLQGFSDVRCGGCHGIGCLDASIGGHALPTPLQERDVSRVATLLAQAISRQHSDVALVVLGGGLPRRYPSLIAALRRLLDPAHVQPTAAPARAKSAAPWGLVHLLRSSG
jgi:predicted NBD/HSP70 family sugar kinase